MYTITVRLTRVKTMSENKLPDYLHKQASALLGWGTETIGKTQARQEFLPIVADLNQHPRAIEITDRERPVAMLLAYEHYVALISQLHKLVKTTSIKKPDLMGSVIINGDLVAASKEIAKEFETAIERSAADL